MSDDSNTSHPDVENANLEISRLRNELRHALAEGSKAQQEMRKKIHDLAREFRVPLASVLGFTDLLSATYKSNPAELNQIAMAGHQLMDLVKEMERTAAAGASGQDPVVAGTPPNVEVLPTAVRTVLHIEDNETNFHLVETILEDRANIETLWAPSGEAGLAVACQRAPALILLDLNLPDIHGSDVLVRLRNNPLTHSIPVIVLSADVSPSQIERMLQAGARNYLTKPFDIKRLLCLVDESLGFAA
jgi:CheY-like chemotaxis protein